MDAPVADPQRSAGQGDRAARAEAREAELIEMIGELVRIVPDTDVLVRVMAPDVAGHMTSTEPTAEAAGIDRPLAGAPSL